MRVVKVFCTQCGQKLPDDAKFCLKCGYSLQNLVDSDTDPESTTDLEPSLVNDIDSIHKLINNLFKECNEQRIEIDNNINPEHLEAFVNTTSYSIGLDIPLILFDSTQSNEAVSGWLLTSRNIYNNSFLKDQPLLIKSILNLEFGQMINTINCIIDDKKIVELDFATTNDLRLPVAHLIETLSGKKLISEESKKSSSFKVEADEYTPVVNKWGYEKSELAKFGYLNRSIVCPHCQHKGEVYIQSAKRKKGISGAKATAAVITSGLSVLLTGLSKKEGGTAAYCANCNTHWFFSAIQ